MNTVADLRSFVADFLRIPLDKLPDDAPLSDLIADSFQAVELLVALQDEFPCTLNHEDLGRIETLGGLFALMNEKMNENINSNISSGV
jgi:acyl carrier protein